MVGEETPDDLLKPLPLSGYGMVSSLPQFLLNFLEFRPAAVASGLPLKLENSSAAFTADQRVADVAVGVRRFQSF